MADNIPVTHGTGTDVATDEIAGVHHQRVKVQHGVEGAAVDVSTTDPLPVEMSSAPLPTNASSEPTLIDIRDTANDLLTAFTAEVAELPHQPLDATNDMTPGNVSQTGAGEIAMVTATASQTTKLYEYAVTVPGAGTIEIRDGISGAYLRKHIFPALGGLVREFRSRPYAKTTANTALVFYWSGSGEANIDFDYVKGA